MRKFLSSFAVILLVVVSLGKAEFAWDYTPDPLAPATQFNLKCGPTTGVYPSVFAIGGDTARSQKVAPVVQGPGTYFCVITASNEFGESLPSNEVDFRAGNEPRPASNLRIEVR